MSLLGLGTKRDVEEAVRYFEIAEQEPQAWNALGVVYYEAPDQFEQNPTKL